MDCVIIHVQDVKRQDRVGGLHFFNPVPVMRLLEVVKADQTSEDTMEAMISWGRAIGMGSPSWAIPKILNNKRCLYILNLVQYMNYVAERDTRQLLGSRTRHRDNVRLLWNLKNEKFPTRCQNGGYHVVNGDFTSTKNLLVLSHVVATVAASAQLCTILKLQCWPVDCTGGLTQKNYVALSLKVKPHC